MISTEVVNLTAERQASTVLWKCTQSVFMIFRVMRAFEDYLRITKLHYIANTFKCHMYPLLIAIYTLVT